MKDSYFSDRELGPSPRTAQEITNSAWKGIAIAITSRVDDGSFGSKFPLECDDGMGPYGTNSMSFSIALEAEVPQIEWPPRMSDDGAPSTLAILDLIEFCHRAVAKPVEGAWHPFFSHTHLSFQASEGQALFRDDINRILARNKLAFELKSVGRVERLATPVLGDALQVAGFRTGDGELDRLLESARSKYLDPDMSVREESLEKLWDAWERLKTIEPGKNKKESSLALLDRALTEGSFRVVIESEARELTRIGNSFDIRHSETDQEALKSSEHVDYLFHRLFALIRLLLTSTGRGG